MGDKGLFGVGPRNSLLAAVAVPAGDHLGAVGIVGPLLLEVLVTKLRGCLLAVAGFGGG